MAIMLATALTLVSFSVAAEPLTSRNDEQTKRAIVEFCSKSPRPAKLISSLEIQLSPFVG
jgi:hypothetical protein